MHLYSKDKLDLVKLDRVFYRDNAVELSRKLLGKYLVHVVNNAELIGRIVEVEAYMGFEDKAAHSYKGRRTNRTEVMYGEEGHAYVYFIYGMHYCLNIVAAEEEIAQAVLIRAIEPVKGIDNMAYYRYGRSFEGLLKSQVRNMTNGPGKLCKALNITKQQNGEDLTGNKLFICDHKKICEAYNIIEAKRIGIDYAEEAKDYLWRFYIEGNPYVSIIEK